MKNKLYSFLVLIILFTGCKKDKNIAKDASSGFNVDVLTIPNSSGKAEFTIKWEFAEWEISTDVNGFISGFTFLKGGSLNHTSATRVSFNYTDNPTSMERKQDITLTNKTTGEKTVLTVTQSAPLPVELTLDASIQYQNITGFGGMNTSWGPKITVEDVEKMYSSNGLGYNMMRVMIYPKKADWGTDVASILKAQSLGARILASPWTPPSEMKSSNSNLHGYLLPTKYGDYVQHLNDFIAFMKDKGIIIEAISIQNEPDWSPEYDGCEWSPEQILDFIKNYAGNINAKVVAAEAVNFKKMYTDPVLNDPIAVNNLDIAGGHLYGGGLLDYPLARQKGKEIWMTEHLLNEVNSGMGWPQALVFAKELNDCMESNFNAYFWWYLKRYYSMLGDGEKGTTMGEILKRGYVLSHYAKYATGRKRIQIGKIANNANVNITAYSGQNDITLVFVNNGTSAVPSVKINLTTAVKSGEGVITSETQNMEPTNVDIGADKKSVMISLPAKTVVSIKLNK
ncbi:hypothetical protein [Pedobacter alpinus]|uniref:Glucuronoarabinoxylan endo-1,4-beta-xylanase n=1 Tax=Pedobacter alpinus TaxID=1590643 RepID=A0ABW5TUX3_9SPHI